MNQSTASSLRKLAVGAALAFGLAAVSSSTACTVTISCTGGTVDCGGICVDTANDDFDCGGCGITCSASESCIGGVCAGACTADLDPCTVDSECCPGPDGRSICAGDNRCGCVDTGTVGCAVDTDCCDPSALCQPDGSCQ